MLLQVPLQLRFHSCNQLQATLFVKYQMPHKHLKREYIVRSTQEKHCDHFWWEWSMKKFPTFTLPCQIYPLVYVLPTVLNVNDFLNFDAKVDQYTAHTHYTRYTYRNSQSYLTLQPLLWEEKVLFKPKLIGKFLLTISGEGWDLNPGSLLHARIATVTQLTQCSWVLTEIIGKNRNVARCEVLNFQWSINSKSKHPKST